MNLDGNPTVVKSVCELRSNATLIISGSWILDLQNKLG